MPTKGYLPEWKISSATEHIVIIYKSLAPQSPEAVPCAWPQRSHAACSPFLRVLHRQEGMVAQQLTHDKALDAVTRSPIPRIDDGVQVRCLGVASVPWSGV